MINGQAAEPTWRAPVITPVKTVTLSQVEMNGCILTGDTWEALRRVLLIKGISPYKVNRRGNIKTITENEDGSLTLEFE